MYTRIYGITIVGNFAPYRFSFITKTKTSFASSWKNAKALRRGMLGSWLQLDSKDGRGQSLSVSLSDILIKRHGKDAKRLTVFQLRSFRLNFPLPEPSPPPPRNEPLQLPPLTTTTAIFSRQSWNEAGEFQRASYVRHFCRNTRQRTRYPPFSIPEYRHANAQRPSRVTHLHAFAHSRFYMPISLLPLFCSKRQWKASRQLRTMRPGIRG